MSVTSWGAPVHCKTSLVQKTILNLGICLGGRANLRPLARTDVSGCVRVLEERLTTHWSGGAERCLFALFRRSLNLQR